jgi:hypothetical protein
MFQWIIAIKKNEFCQQKPLQLQGPKSKRMSIDVNSSWIKSKNPIVPGWLQKGPHLFPGTLHLLRLEERRLADGGAKRVTFQEPRRRQRLHGKGALTLTETRSIHTLEIGSGWLIYC